MFKEINFAYLKAVLDHKKLLQEPVVIANDIGNKEIVITNEVLVLNTTNDGEDSILIVRSDDKHNYGKMEKELDLFLDGCKFNIESTVSLIEKDLSELTEESNSDISERSLLEILSLIEKGTYLKCIQVEEDSPFRLHTAYPVTDIDKVDKNNIKQYLFTLLDHIDFQYTGNEILRYFKIVKEV